MTLQIPRSFPSTRLRRLRQTPWIRALTAENQLTSRDLIWSIIVHEGNEPQVPIASMPGIARLNISEATKTAKLAAELGIHAVAIFPHIDPSKKNEHGSEALNKDGLIPNVLKGMKDAAPEVGLICDVALDPFTTHGHDGIINENGYVDNDETTKILVEQALIEVESGADVVAPSDMMDGRISAIRSALESANLPNALILSYASKYASGFYGPYRDAIGSSSLLKGDKKTYQQDPANSDEALEEIALDISEGADMVMVKPGLPYLDIIQRISTNFSVPTVAFQVSGEYAQIKAAGQNGWIDEDKVRLETLLCLKRAGACAIITYYADWAARQLG